MVLLILHPNNNIWIFMSFTSQYIVSNNRELASFEKPVFMVLYTKKYILASHSNLKIADSLCTDRETETQEDERICQRDSYPQQI